MTRKRGRPTTSKRANDEELEDEQPAEEESPKKRVKFMEVSNQQSSDDDDYVPSDEHEESSPIATRVTRQQRAVRQNPKIKVNPPPAPSRPKRSARKKNDAAKEGVASGSGESEAGVSGSQSNESDRPLNLSKSADDEEEPQATIVTVPREEEEEEESGAPLGADLSSVAEIIGVQPNFLEIAKEKGAADESALLFDVSQEVEGSQTATLSVPQDGETATVEFDQGREVESLQTVTFVVAQEAEAESSVPMEFSDGVDNQVGVECLDTAGFVEEDNLSTLLMGLEDSPLPQHSSTKAIVLPIEGSDDYVLIPTQSSSDPNSEEMVDNAMNDHIENLENKNMENILADKRTVQVQPKVDSPLAKKITEKILEEARQKIRLKKPRSTKVKQTTTFKSKERAQRQRKKSGQAEVEQPASPPPVQQTISEDDEISCNVCEQKLEDELRCDSGGPLGGFEEGTAILDSRLLLFDGDEAEVSIEDTRSYNKITSFSVYCKNNHLCRFDSGLIEKDREIYFSGWVKPIHSDDSSTEDGVPGKRFGPIGSWWVTGFDVGEQPTVAISTELCDYVCMEPAPEYAPFMDPVMRKIYISKIVIEFLIYEPNASYEDLLAKLQNTPVPNGLLNNFTEDTLLHYAPFICNQVITFDDTAKPKEQLIVAAPCIRRLINLAGIRFEVDSDESPMKGKQIFRERQFEHKIDYREKMLRQVAEDRRDNSNASELIDNLLPIQDKLLTPSAAKPLRCGACERCSRKSCRECRACKARNYEACYQRRCFNREIMEENDEDLADETDFSEMQAFDSFTHYRNSVRPLCRQAYDVVWGTGPLAKDQKRTYYGSVRVDHKLISPGDFIDVRSTNPGVPPQIMKVAYMYEDEHGAARFHACFLWSGKYTVLGDISDRKELFFVNRCIDVDCKCVVGKVGVHESSSGSLDNSMIEERSPYTYVCQRTYDPIHGSFHDLEPHDEAAREKYGAPFRYCWVCARNNLARARDAPKAFERIVEEDDGREIYESVRYRGEEYRAGTGVYLKPKSLYYKYPMLNKTAQAQSSSKTVDEDKHTEYYRKAMDPEPSQDVPAPFDVGYVKEIFKREGKLHLTVVKLYRTENTHKAETLGKDADANVLYWSEEDATLTFSYVVGKCYVTHKSSTPDVHEWSRQGPDRFYFSQMYKKDAKIESIDDVEEGQCGCPSGLCDAPEYPEVRLNCLNIFAGCGGLSLGLKEAGAAECKWAIEADKAAADTFKLNHPETAVFTGTCAEMMQKISKNNFKVDNKRLPKKGDVDLLCATMPPESWRRIDTLDAFKNSNIATFLVYLEYYQPAFFVLEADDVLLKRSIVLKLSIASFIRLGYQVAFDLVQVGNFGAPQMQYRTVIVGAARGRSLPDCPKSQHVVSKSSSHGCIVIDDKMYQRRNWTESAPCRATTVRDAILDLAALELSHGEEVKYSTQSVSFYQRMMRRDLKESDRDLAFNHSSKDLGLLVHARMSQVPIAAGSDWRDLPNIELPLRDGTFTKKLVYSYDDPELGKGKRGQPRGVCSCSAGGRRCEPSCAQEGTLVPWHLVHSGKRHGHWAGLYGKLQWNGVFVGATTNPEPLARKAPVIHPSKNRVLSVRECARAQGFPDSFVFAGGCPVHAMYRQIGLSTSPLLARAIGREIAKSAATSGPQ